VDEAWMGEQAYHEAKDGIARQELLTGMFGFEERMLIRHKLHIFLGSVCIRLFGFHLFGFRMVSLFSGLALGWMMRRYLKGMGRERHREFLYSIAILLSTPLMFRYVKIYRPELLMAALGFASFLFIVSSIERKSLLSAAMAGIMAGFAVLAHLNGTIFIVAGLSALLLEKRWRQAAVFFPVSTMVSAAYLWDIVGDYSLFKWQFFNNFVVEQIDYGVLAPIIKLFSEHQRYFRTPEIIGVSVLFILTLPLVFSKKTPGNKVFWRYLLVLFMSLGIAAKSITTKYAMPLLPFLALGIASAVSPWFQREIKVNRLYGSILALVLFAHIGFGLFYDGRNAFAGKSFLEKENALMASDMERGGRVLAPGNFIYNEIENFEIRDIYAARYFIMNEQKRDFNLSSLCEYALANRFEYIILDREYRDFGNIHPQNVFPPVWGYEVLREYSNGAVLMKKFVSNKTSRM